MVEADMYWPPMARLTSGVRCSSELSLSQSSLEMPPTNAEGSKVGALAMPRISPFVQSRHTMAAASPARAVPWARSMPIFRPSSHARWILSEMVSLISLPGRGSTEPAWPTTVPAESTRTVCSPRMPWSSDS